MTPRSRGLAIRVLGPLEVTAGGAPLVVDTRKALAILVLVAVERRPFARDELAALLWPESDDESARGALRRTLSVLRSALADRWLRVDRSTVALDPDGTWVDLAVVEDAAGQSDAGTLETAAGLARGPFLAGFSLRDSPEFDDWRATRAVAADRAIAAVLDGLSAASETAGDLAGAIAATTRRVDLEPLDEPSHRRLMALLAQAGDRASAIRQYRACVAVLERELGVAPLAETTELYEAIRDARDEAPRTPPSVVTQAAPAPGPAPRPGTLPLVGRDAELAAILGAWRAPGGDGRLVLVHGEAGIGKSRLADAAGESVAAGGGRVLLSRAYAAEAGIAYGPVVGLLRAALDLPDAAARLARLPTAVVGEIGRLVVLPSSLDAARAGGERRDPADPAARIRLLDAIATTLAALAGGPVRGLVVAEDVHWADDASREALAWLARRLDGRGIVLLLTWRPEDLDDAGAAFATGVERVPGATVLELGRLDRAGVAGLVAAASTAGFASPAVDDLLEASEGLPLFVVEALLAGDGAEPRLATAARSVKALLRERLASVGETAAQVLAAAAVIGRSFDLALVRGTSGRSDDEAVGAVEELVRRGIVRELDPAGTSYDFAHASFRDAAYEATSLARRRLLHGRAADLLRAEPARRDDPARLAQVAGHERAAGRDADAARSFREAGSRARSLSALREAAAFLETALALGHPDVAGIQVELGEIRTAQGDYAGAIAALEAAASVAGDRDLPGIELRLGRVHARRGDDATAASHLDAAIEALDHGGAADATLARALVERALVAVGQGRLELAESSARRGRELADALGDASIAGAADRMVGLAARERGDVDAARAALRQSLALAETDPDPGAAVAARNALALVEASAGDSATAIGLLEAAIEVCRRTGEIHLEAAVENNLADLLHAAGRESASMDHLKRAVALFADVGGRPGELEPEIWKLATW
jgi:DNA-binding SARP family transcriptional activator/tetratricopeptide (TPR) repeat protein